MTEGEYVTSTTRLPPSCSAISPWILVLVRLLYPLLLVDKQRVRRHVLVDHASGSYHTVVPNVHPFQDDCATAYPAMFSNRDGCCGVSLLLNGFAGVLVAVVVVIHLYVLAEDAAITYGNTRS